MPRPAVRPPGFVHVDLDGLWTLAGAYGYPEGRAFEADVVFERGLPRLLELLDARGIRATFFVLGRDLEHPVKRQAIAALVAGGHEPANHTFSHRMDLERLSEDALEHEIAGTSEAIRAATGRPPLGFRAPGYGAGPRALAICSRAGLRYDGSCLPTWWAPVLRQLARRMRRRVGKALGGVTRAVPGADLQYGGTPANRTDPLAPVWWRAAGGGEPVLRLPLAVSPLLRLPLQASLGLMLGERRMCAGLRALARRGRPVTWLLHGMDAVGVEDLAGRLPPALACERAFRLPLQTKLACLAAGLDEMQRSTDLQLTGEWLPMFPDSDKD